MSIQRRPLPLQQLTKSLLLKVRSPVLLNIFWLSIDQLSRLAIGLVVGIWIARYLGPQQWGEINYTLALVSIMTSITNLGMDGFLVKELLDSPAQKNQILGTAFVTRMASIPFCALAALLFFYFSGAPTSYYYLFAFLSPNFLNSARACKADGP
jgi:polysaccharide transporter, PST family